MLKPNSFYGGNTTITLKCSLISHDRFQAEMSGFSNEAIGVFKTIPSRSYGKYAVLRYSSIYFSDYCITDPKTRIWSFDIKDYDLLLSKFTSLANKVIVEKLPKFVLNCLKQQKINTDIDFEKIDPVLSSSLLPFQVEGLRYVTDY